MASELENIDEHNYGNEADSGLDEDANDPDNVYKDGKNHQMRSRSIQACVVPIDALLKKHQPAIDWIQQRRFTR